MTTAIEALRRELATAEAGLKCANESYNELERELQEMQRRTTCAYEGRARNQRSVDRYNSAISSLESEDFLWIKFVWSVSLVVGSANLVMGRGLDMRGLFTPKCCAPDTKLWR